MIYNTINEIILTCVMLVNGMSIEKTYPSVYNNSLVEISLDIQDAKRDRIRACVEIGNLALKENVDPILAIAVAKHESKFARKIVGGIGKISKPSISKHTQANKIARLDKEEIKGSPSLGIMQVIPKWWCKLQSGRDDWQSKTDVLFIPNIQRTCKKKKKLKTNHYYDEQCQEIYCDTENCEYVECDLEKAGIIALQTYAKIYKTKINDVNVLLEKKMRDRISDVLCHYNFGGRGACPQKSKTYSKEVIITMLSILEYYKRMKRLSKLDQIILLGLSNAPLDLIISSK